MKKKTIEGAQPKPSLDEIITISKEGGEAKVELKQGSESAPPELEQKQEQMTLTNEKAAKPAKPRKRKGKPELKIPIRKSAPSGLGGHAKPTPVVKTECHPSKMAKPKPLAKAAKNHSQPQKTMDAQMPAAAKLPSKAKHSNEAVEKPLPDVSLADVSFMNDVVPAASKKPTQMPELVQLNAGISGDKLALAEAALFLSPKPLMLDEMAKIMGVNSLGYVKETLENLKSLYNGRGIEVSSSDAGWEMQVRPQYLSHVAHLAPYADLSEGPKRALALILFKEPMKQSELIKMQGNKVYDYLRVLEKMNMIRREPSGRTKLLTLTNEFERYFGEEKEAIRARLGQELSIRPSAQQRREEKKQMTVKEAAAKFKLDVSLEDG